MQLSAPPMNLLSPELVRDLVSLIQQAEVDDNIAQLRHDIDVICSRVPNDD